MGKHVVIRSTGVLLMLTLLTVLSSTAFAVEFYLRAEATQKTMTAPSNQVVPMWGYALTNSTFSTGAATVPGPLLTVPSGDATLTIHLQNNLPEPTSIVIPGQIATMTPVWDNGSTGNRPGLAARVRSFTHEAAANGGRATYTWNNVKPGTYLYESGTHPSIQIQMGLYGALKKDAAPGQAYSASSTIYNWEAVMVLSEVDPDLHEVVANGSYGTVDPALNPKMITSTVDYAPKYFLYDGQACSDLMKIDGASISAGDKILLRILNAGLTTRAPLVHGLYATLLAEDGNLFPFSRDTYCLNLPAAKTMDVMIAPAAPGTVSVTDRRLNTSVGDPASAQISVTEAARTATGDGVTPAPSGGGGGGGGGGCFIGTALGY